MIVNQTLCVFSNTKNIKPIRRDFHLAAGGTPRGGGGDGGGHFLFSEIQPDLVCELLT